MGANPGSIVILGVPEMREIRPKQYHFAFAIRFDGITHEPAPATLKYAGQLDLGMEMPRCIETGKPTLSNTKRGVRTIGDYFKLCTHSS